MSTEPTNKHLQKPRSQRFTLWGSLDSYLFGEVFQSFLGATLVFFFIFFMLQMLRLSDFLIIHHVPLVLVAKIAGCLLLSFSHFVYPTAFLSAVIATFGRLSSESEVIAMRAGGWSLDRIAWPVGVLGFFVSLVTLLSTLELAPYGERTLREAIHTVGARKLVSSIQPSQFNGGFYDLLLYAGGVDPERSTLTEVFLFDERDKNKPTIVVAKKGEIVPIEADHPLASKTLLRLFQGSILPLTPGEKENALSSSSIPDVNQQAERIQFSEYSLYLKVDVSDVSLPDHPRMASFQYLNTRIATAEPFSHGFYDFTTEKYKRFALALSPMFFVLLGIGLGTQPTRSAGSKSFLYTLLTAVLYWFTLIYAISYSVNAKIPPIIGMSLPNLMVAVFGVYFYSKRRKFT